jgi:xanthine dehydrogenase accessory factor
MNTIYEEIADLIRQDSPGVLCIVTQTAGSSPRKAGSKMLVRGDGSSFGTIGGGKVEYEVMNKAKELLGTGNPVLLSFKLDPSYGLECGGEMEVYLEPFGTHQKLYIFGAGHVGTAVARLAKRVGFRVVLCDERQGVADNQNLKDVKIVYGEYHKVLADLKFCETDYALVTTHAHTFDVEVTAHLAAQGLTWLGMIGSRSKIATARNRFANEFGLNLKQIDAIEMPVGIAIAAETPDEIALSIVARIVDVKNRLLGYTPKTSN